MAERGIALTDDDAWDTIMRELMSNRPAPEVGDPVSWIHVSSVDGSSSHLTGTVVSRRLNPGEPQFWNWVMCDAETCGCHTGGGSHIVFDGGLIDPPVIAGPVLDGALF